MRQLPKVRLVHPLASMPSHIVTHHGHAVLITDRRGSIGAGTEGLYWRLTRFLSRLRVLADGAAPRLVAAHQVSFYRSIVYYLAPSPAGTAAAPDPAADTAADEIVQNGIELQINRFVG